MSARDASAARALRAAAVLAAAAAGLLAGAAPASAAFGDGFGIAPINGPGLQGVPALPGESKAFWAGTCDRGSAPAIGQPIPGGIGSRPATIDVPNTPENQPLHFDTHPAPAVASHCIDWGAASGYPGTTLHTHPWTQAPAWRLGAVTGAGAHPDATATFEYAKEPNEGRVDGSVDNIVAELPAGFVGDPTATPKCSAGQFARKPLACPPSTQIGVVQLVIASATSGNLGGAEEELLPVYNLEPRRGNAAEFGFGYASAENATTVRAVADARTNGDFGVRVLAAQIPAALPLVGQSITLWGVPWAAHNDLWRAPAGTSLIPQWGLDGSPDPEQGLTGVTARTPTPWQPQWGPIRPFVSNPTECDGAQPTVELLTDSYQHQGAFTAEGVPDRADPDWKSATSASPPVTGCAQVGFDPMLSIAGTATAADAPTGLAVTLSTPQNRTPRDGAGDPLPTPAPGASESEIGAYRAAAGAYWASDAGRATSHLDRVVVRLPEGVTVNPAGAAGLEGCSDAGIGVADATAAPVRFNDGDPFDKDGGADGAECPDGARIGSVEVDTPLLDEPLTGEVVLGTPRSTDPQSGEMFRMFVVARSAERGLVAKIYGSAVADPATGRLTATFERNPRVPFEQMRLRLKGGERGLLALPQRCGAHDWLAQLSPWSIAHDPAGIPAQRSAPLPVSERCAFGFAPTLRAGVSPRRGGGSGALGVQLGRPEGERWLQSVSVELPAGLLAAVGDVPLCGDAQARANACPEASRIGSVDAGAGSGAPFFLERKGAAYLTEGYKGAPYGLLTSVPVEAGPFRGPLALTPIAVRQALHVDPSTAEVTAVSDHLPLVWHGIPLRVRQVTVNVDRAGFVRNPTSCARKRFAATLGAPEGDAATATAPFQATGCAALRFKPKLRLRLTGRRQTSTGGHPGVRARVTQSGGEAGIRRTVVRLPRTLALDPGNAQALCEYADGTRADLENHCPKTSIVGRAAAVSPLLARPLRGDVYFVKNVRTDTRTGNRIRTLPMIVVALRGEIALNLRGQSSVRGGTQLVNTFAGVPDAPVRSFRLSIAGGRHGILAVTRSRRGKLTICGRQIATTRLDGHNGKRIAPDVRIKTPCRQHKRPQRGKRRR